MKEKTVRIKDYVFTLHQDSATVTAWNKSRASVELPNAVEGLPVCDISPDAFAGCNALRLSGASQLFQQFAVECSGGKIGIGQIKNRVLRLTQAVSHPPDGRRFANA